MGAVGVTGARAGPEITQVHSRALHAPQLISDISITLSPTSPRPRTPSSLQFLTSTPPLLSAHRHAMRSCSARLPSNTPNHPAACGRHCTSSTAPRPPYQPPPHTAAPPPPPTTASATATSPPANTLLIHLSLPLHPPKTGNTASKVKAKPPPHRECWFQVLACLACKQTIPQTP